MVNRNRLNKTFFIFFFLALAGFVSVFSIAQAQEADVAPIPSVDYGEGAAIVDSDLDGLTDEGEKQIYQTDPQNPDTDGDGVLDGAEVLGGSDPLDSSVVLPVSESTLEASDDEPLAAEVVSPEKAAEEKETPWAWYVSRSSGLLAFLLLYISMFLGATIRIPGLRRIWKPAYTLKIHCWVSLQALIFAFVHGTVLFFDKFLNFRLVEIFVPFARKTVPGVVDTNLLAMGIVGFYLMALILATSYAKEHLSHTLWRTVHSTNLALYVFVVIHSLFQGTDLKDGTVWRPIFIVANAILFALLLTSVGLRLKDAFLLKRKSKIG